MAINYGKLNAKLTPRGSLKATMGVSGPLNSDYEALINKPQINGNELIGDKSNADLGIPTALEDLTDDSTHRVVTDTQIDAWNNKSDFSGSYDDLTDKPTIPDELADLTDDSTHRLVTDTEKTTWNAKSDFSGSYNDLTDVPANLVQDANYVHTDNNYDDTAKGKVNALGTASTKNVPVSGDASTSEVVLGNDTRLTDDRNAKDVYSWAKESTKPEYTATEVGAIASTLKGTANGVAELDANGKVPSAQLPSYVDDVLEYASTSAFPQTGESGKIYIALDTNKTYRWGGSAYVEISESLALGETDSTAYAGNKGKQNADNIATIQGLIPSSATTSNKLATANDIPDISGKADKSEMSVSTSGDKTTIQLKSGTSAEVLNQHQDISGKVDKVDGKGLSTNDYDNTAKGIVDGVTSALADKVDKVNGKGLSTEDYTTAEKNKLGAISAEANKVTSSSTNGHINIDGVDTTVYDDTSVQSDIEDIQDDLSTDTTTTDGNPLYFSTLSAQNAESTIIDLEPIQDLHGYSNPWVGGAGKNLLPMTVDAIKIWNNTWNWSGNTASVGTISLSILTDSDNNVIGIKANGSYSQTSFFIAAIIPYSDLPTTMIVNGSPQGGHAYQDYQISCQASGSDVGIDTGSGVTINKSSITEGADLYIRIRIAGNYSVSNMPFYPMLRDSSIADSSFAPYINKCSITGRTEIGILGVGANIWDEEWELGVYNQNGTKGYDDKRIRSKNYISCLPNTDYYFAYTGSISGLQFRICYYDAGKNFISYISDKNPNNIYTTPNNAYYMTFCCVSVQITTYSNDICINLSDASKNGQYRPYTKSNDITIDLGQTVYGAKHGVENGGLVVSHIIADLGDLTWSSVGSGDHQRFEANVTTDSACISGSVAVDMKCEGLKASTGSAAYNHTEDNIIGFNDATTLRAYSSSMVTMTGAEFKSVMSGIHLCYELADSYKTEIQLRPNTISLLSGVNNISTDGDMITLTYRNGKVATLEPVSVDKDGLMSASDKRKLDDLNLDSEVGKVYSASWVATSSSAAGTALTDAINLPKGKYLIVLRSPYSVEGIRTDYIFSLSFDDVANYDYATIAGPSYSQMMAVITLNSDTSVKAISGASTIVTWDSSYISRGSLTAIRLKD